MDEDLIGARSEAWPLVVEGASGGVEESIGGGSVWEEGMGSKSMGGDSMGEGFAKQKGRM